MTLPILKPMTRSFSFNPQRWLTAIRLSFMAAVTFGASLTPEQLLATLAAIEAIMLAMGDFSTPNAKLEPSTVVGAKAGMPAPGVNDAALKEPFV